MSIAHSEKSKTISIRGTAHYRNAHLKLIISKHIKNSNYLRKIKPKTAQFSVILE